MEPMPVLLAEAASVADLGPIAHTRPAFELRCGALNLRERIDATGCASMLCAQVRDELSALLPTVDVEPVPASGEVLVVDAQLHGTVEALRELLTGLEPGGRLTVDGRLAIARVDVSQVDSLGIGSPADAPATDRLSRFDRPWQLVPANDQALVDDAASLRELGGVPRRIFGVSFRADSRRVPLLGAFDWSEAMVQMAETVGVTWIEPDRVLMAPNAVVRPGAVIDAEEGPVILGPGVVVNPLSVVVGPAYLGPGTVVNPGAKLREGTSLGAFCKVGGEIEESIVLDLSNKQHDGFLGHALVGSWVNLGADTNGSDLKNNYGPVRVDLGGGAIDTGETFVGQHLADHVKTGIDTMLTTGGVVGVAGNVFGGGFVPRFVPAFGWGGPDGVVTYRLDDALETARTAMARRDAEWTPEVESLLRHVFERTRAQRLD